MKLREQTVLKIFVIHLLTNFTVNHTHLFWIFLSFVMKLYGVFM